MATLRTGPFLVPNWNPITHLFLNFANPSDRILTAIVRVDQAFPKASAVPISTSSPLLELLPPTSVIVLPKSVVTLSQEIGLIQLRKSRTAKLQMLVVTISGDVDSTGNLIEVSVTGGYSSDGGASLDESEPTIFFRHSDFIVISSNGQNVEDS